MVQSPTPYPPQGGQPSANPLCALEPQPLVPVPGLAPFDSAEPQRGSPSSQPLRAPEPQPCVPVSALEVVHFAAQPSCALNALHYGHDDNLVSGFIERWLDRDRFVAKASEVYTVHEMAPATRWAQENGTERSLVFEQWWAHDVGEGNAPRQLQWASKFYVWGNSQ